MIFYEFCKNDCVNIAKETMFVHNGWLHFILIDPGQLNDQ